MAAVQLFTTMEKLVEVERMIEAIRFMRHPSADDERRLDVLRSIALDLRGRLDAAPSVALLQLDRKIVAMRGCGLDVGPKIGAANELLKRWPTVKQAVELFGAQIENGGAA